MILHLLITTALAAGLHAGIPVHQRDLGEPDFQSAENGWTAPLASGTGFVRVYVGRNDAEAVDWFQRTRDGFSRLILVPGTLLLLHLGYGILLLWVWLAAYISVLAVGLWWRWRSGKWKHIRVIDHREGLAYIPPVPDEIH